jgi:sugar phosphate isomerase/epimerase
MHMRLGYLAPLTTETIATAQRLGYDGIEVDAGWVDRPRLDELERALPRLQEALLEAGIQVTSVAVYGNAVATPAAETIGYYARAIELAVALGGRVLGSITGRDNTLSLDDNLSLLVERFGPIADLAQSADVRIAFEPWPGRVTGYGPYRWTNLALSPVMYDRIFALLPQPALGIEYDPSHFAWQGMDYVQIIHDYGDRIHHVHAKDVLIDEVLLKRGGVHASGWWRTCLPGLGQIDWPLVMDALAQVNYRGDVAVEHEDADYRGERREEGLALALKTLRPLIEARFSGGR